METPAIKFAVSRDGVRIAYNTWGDGPTMVIVPPIVSNVEMAWEHEVYRRVFERMGRYVRVIAFDKRGIGMSDRFDEAPNNEHRISDFLAVMAAEEVERTHVSGISEGGAMAQVFAAEHPDRVDRLVIRLIGEHSGRIVKSTGDGLLATFDSPSPAVGAARALRTELARLGLRIRAGIHAGEIEARDDDISGFAVNLAARVESAAPDGEVYVTSTVGDMLIGGSFEFEDPGGYELKGIDGVWTLRRLV